jgi:Tfp pilus assembly protein PilX
MNIATPLRRQSLGAPCHAVARCRQQGVILIIALIILIAMTLAGIAMVRSVDTGTVIAGNLAFKQSASASGDAGVEAAITWLSSGADLTQNSAANGYYATSQTCLDLTGSATAANMDPTCTAPYVALDWTNTGAVVTLATDATGNTPSYIINRMCDSVGALNGATCATAQSAQGGSSQGMSREMTTYQPGHWDSVTNRGYYRITSRIAGPRSTVSYVQVVVSL